MVLVDERPSIANQWIMRSEYCSRHIGIIFDCNKARHIDIESRNKVLQMLAYKKGHRAVISQWFGQHLEKMDRDIGAKHFIWPL